MINELTQEKLKNLLHYDPDSGIFRWRYSVARRIKPWDKAGAINGRGYNQILISNKPYLAHRLAWLYVYGVLPESSLDHLNRDKTDNRISNLREVSSTENNQNASKRQDNTSGFTGVHYHKTNGIWVAYINVNKQRIHLGVFDTPEKASKAYLKAKQQLHVFNIKGIV